MVTTDVTNVNANIEIAFFLYWLVVSYNVMESSAYTLNKNEIDTFNVKCKEK